MCIMYARCSIARLLITCYDDEEESFNSFLPRTFYLKMVVVVVVVVDIACHLLRTCIMVIDLW